MPLLMHLQQGIGDDTVPVSRIPNYNATLLTSTVVEDELVFADPSITTYSIIDGPYILDTLVDIRDLTQVTGSITYHLGNDSANAKTAYIWVRALPS